MVGSCGPKMHDKAHDKLRPTSLPTLVWQLQWNNTQNLFSTLLCEGLLLEAFFLDCFLPLIQFFTGIVVIWRISSMLRIPWTETWHQECNRKLVPVEVQSRQQAVAYERHLLKSYCNIFFKKSYNESCRIESVTPTFVEKALYFHETTLFATANRVKRKMLKDSN